MCLANMAGLLYPVICPLFESGPTGRRCSTEQLQTSYTLQQLQLSISEHFTQA